MMIELIDLDLIDCEEYIKINSEIKEICRHGALQHQCYFLEYPWIVKNIPKGVKNIIDVGGGLGALQFYLGKRYEIMNIDRMPYQNILSDISKRADIKLHYFQTELGDLSLTFKIDKLADCIVSCSSIEHNLELYTENCLRNMKTMIHKGGYIIITVPFTKTVELRDNMITFTEERIKKLADKVGLKLLNDKSNFSKFEEYIEKYKTINVNTVPGGFILQK